MFQDKILKCRECGADFVFTAGEQEFFNSRGLMNEPGRCKACRDTRRHNRNREFFDTVCSQCGGPARLPFVPRDENKPVYCSACFDSIKGQAF